MNSCYEDKTSLQTLEVFCQETSTTHHSARKVSYVAEGLFLRQFSHPRQLGMVRTTIIPALISVVVVVTMCSYPTEQKGILVGKCFYSYNL